MLGFRCFFLLGTNLIFRYNITGRNFFKNREMCYYVNYYDFNILNNNTAINGLKNVGNLSKAELSFPKIY